MHGLVFVTWEKYLGERFGNGLLHTYRERIGEKPGNTPLYTRTYSDEALLAGVQVASQLTGHTLDTLLHEYGRYFITNGLTRHLCSYLLSKATSGLELLLMMRDAHAQMRRTPDALTPPLFAYETLSPNPRELVVIYDSPRKLCTLLTGAFEGAAERFGERVQVTEQSCMKKGAAACRFELRFSPRISTRLEMPVTREQLARQQEDEQLANVVLSALPEADGMTMQELQHTLSYWNVAPEQLRPAVLLRALQHLRFAGLISTSSNEPGDTLATRRYWRAPTKGMV